MANDNTYNIWNKNALLYEARFMDLKIYNQSYDYVCLALTKSNPKILELACGPGNITKYLLSKRPDFDILGTDLVPNMVALAQKNNPGASFEVMDCKHISKLSTTFDAVICGFCLPYLNAEETKKLISDSFNLLNRQGLFYLSFVEGQSANSGLQTNSAGDSLYFYYHPLTGIKKQLEENNFKIEKIFEVDYKKADLSSEIHSIIVCRK